MSIIPGCAKNMLGSGVPVSLFKQQADHHILAMTTIRLGQTGNANDTLKKTNNHEIAASSSLIL